jgi:hypothetical protein
MPSRDSSRKLTLETIFLDDGNGIRAMVHRREHSSHELELK